jgi:EmrB/QacA subfamily drug resistance transporter
MGVRNLLEEHMSQKEPLSTSSIPVPALAQAQGGRATPSTQSEQNFSLKWVIFGVIAIGVFMSTLDASIVNISLPVIAHDFGTPLGGSIEWVLIAYLVALASVLLTAGRLADMIGLRRVWILGLLIFTLSSACCGAAFSLWFLIAMRAVQGVGGAMLNAASFAMLIAAFPRQERGRVLGLNSLIVALGTSIGPTLGGVITAAFTWRGIFYVNVPLGIIGLILSLRIFSGQTQRQSGTFDPLGAILLAVGLACLTGGLSFANSFSLTSPLIIITLLVGVVALIAFPLVEARVHYPIIKLSLFKNRVFVSANVSLVLSFLALYIVSFIMPFYLEELRVLPTQIAGLLLTPLPLSLALVSPLSGLIADKLGSTRLLTAGGLLIACVGLVFIGLLNEHSSAWDIIWRLLLTGAGQALFQAPNNSALMSSVPVTERGSASGFLGTGRVIGQALSVALAGAIFTGLGGAAAGIALQASHGNGVALQQTFLTAFRWALLVCAGIAFLGVFASLVRGQGEKPQG